MKTVINNISYSLFFSVAVLVFFSKATLSNTIISKDVSEALKHTPKWMKLYLKWHTETKQNKSFSEKEEIKYLVLTCHKDHHCGGLSDRLRSIPYFIVAAHKMRRILLIKWQRFELEDFLIPPIGGLDWRLPEEHLHIETPVFQDQCSRHEEGECKEIWERQDIINRTFLFTNARLDLYQEVKNNFITNETSADRAYRSIFDLLFKPIPALQDEIDKTMKLLSLKEKEYSSAHFRYLYPSLKAEGKGRMPEELRNQVIDNAINCAVNISGSTDLPIYFTSDTSENVHYALYESNLFASKYHPLIKVVGIENLNRANIDGGGINYSKPEKFYPAFIDLWLFRNSLCVAYGDGGYGVFGARLSGDSCTIQHQKTFSWTMEVCPNYGNYELPFRH